MNNYSKIFAKTRVLVPTLSKTLGAKGAKATILTRPLYHTIFGISESPNASIDHLWSVSSH